MARIAVWAVFALWVTGCAPGGDSQTAETETTEPSAASEAENDSRRAAPELELRVVDDSRTVALSELKGKVVLVDLWATWCVPCIGELPHLQELSERFDAEDFVMLGIVLESGEREEIVEFLSTQEIDYLQLLGEDDTQEAFGPFLGYPTKYLIDRDGYVVKRYLGIVGEELADDVSELIETGTLSAPAD